MCRRTMPVMLVFSVVAAVLVFISPRAGAASAGLRPTLSTNARQECDDGDPCTEDVWDEENQTCIYPPVDCDDGNVCNGAESCDPETGSCVAGTPLSCDDSNPCTTDSCDPATGCSSVEINCDDGNVCNGAESCDPASGSCVAGTPLSCDDGNVCTTDSCDPATGCSSVEINCDDGDVCNGEESCDPASGSCVPGTPLSCDDGLFCNGVESCDSTVGCRSGTVPDGCADDGLFCNGMEHCDENQDQCYSDSIPCSVDQVCNEATESCLDAMIFSDGFENESVSMWDSFAGVKRF